MAQQAVVKNILSGPAPAQATGLDLGQFFAGDVADAKVFASGKTGFGFYGKMKLPNGERAQVSLNIVVILK